MYPIALVSSTKHLDGFYHVARVSVVLRGSFKRGDVFSIVIEPNKGTVDQASLSVIYDTTAISPTSVIKTDKGIKMMFRAETDTAPMVLGLDVGITTSHNWSTHTASTDWFKVKICESSMQQPPWLKNMERVLGTSSLKLDPASSTVIWPEFKLLLEYIPIYMKPCTATDRLVSRLKACFSDSIGLILNDLRYHNMITQMLAKSWSLDQCAQELEDIQLDWQDKRSSFPDIFLDKLSESSTELESYGIGLLKI